LLRHKKRSTVYKKVQGLRLKTAGLIPFLCPWRTRSSGRPGRVAGPATGWPRGSIELGKGRGAKGDLDGGLTDGGGVKERPEFGRR
jgi:hypothetical protein